MTHEDGGSLRTDRSYPLDEPVERAWTALTRVEEYPLWWPWLQHFDARALAPGERWQARIRVPMPWTLRCTIDIGTVDAPERVDATLTGDVEGRATVTLVPRGAGTTVRLRSDLAPRHRLLRRVHRLVPSLSRRLHDRVVDEAFEQFAHRAEGGAGHVAG